MTRPLSVSYFSDVLCVWAYVSQIRLDELTANFGGRIEVEQHFFNLFGDTETRIAQGWADRGGYGGFNAHVMQVCASFSHVVVSPDVWTVCRPRSCGNDTAHFD